MTYVITPLGRELMNRLDVTEPNELDSVGLLLQIQEDDGIGPFLELLDAYCALVELGVMRWDAIRFGYALLDDEGHEAGFVSVPNVEELFPDVEPTKEETWLVG